VWNKKNIIDYRSVKKVHVMGMWFDSKAESAMYLWLRDKEKSGELFNIRHQVKIQLLPGPLKFQRNYKVDFAATLPNGEEKYFEVKGWETDRWKANRLLWRHLGPGVLEIWKVKWGGLELTEEIVPDNSHLIERLKVIK